MLASKYAETERPQASESTASPTSPKQPSSAGDSKPLPPLPPKAEIEERFDWAEEPMDPPPKVIKKERSFPAFDRPVTPLSEKGHVRKKSSVQVPSVLGAEAPQSVSRSETKHAKKKSSVGIAQATSSQATGTPMSESQKKKSRGTIENPLIDLTDGAEQNQTSSTTRTVKKFQNVTTNATQLLELAPPKPDPSSQPKLATPDLVRRTSTPSTSTLTPARKAISKRGRPCVIRIPREDEDEERQRQPWPREQYLSRLKEFERNGYDVSGYDLSAVDANSVFTSRVSAQNRALFPDPSDEAHERKTGMTERRFNVIIPDKKKWDEYMNQMMEDKLKALGVKPAADEEPPTAVHEMSRQASNSFPGLANSPPPLSSSVNSQHQWQNGMPFSARSFSPATFTNNTSVGGLGSPAPSGPMSGRPGHSSRQSTFGFPFSAQGFNPALSGAAGQQQPYPSQLAASTMSVPSQSGTPIPPGLQRLPSTTSRASPDMFGLEHTGKQTSRVQSSSLYSSTRPDFSRRGTLLSEQSSALGVDMPPQGSQQGRKVSTPPPLRTQENAYGDLAYPTPRGHRHNISLNLEREAENAQYYPGEYVNAERSVSGLGDAANSNVPGAPPASAEHPSPHQSKPSQASKASSSGFNVEAKEFKFEPRHIHSNNQSVTKNPFMLASTPGVAAPKSAVSLLTAHANGETMEGGNFNVTAPVFKPPGQSNFNFTSSFDFSAKKPENKPESKENEKTKDKPDNKIFSGITISEDIVKPARNSKAIPIVNPNAVVPVRKDDAEPQEDEEGRIAQNKDRFKRSKPTMLDGRNEPKFDSPKTATTLNKIGIHTTLPKLDNKIDEPDSDFDDGEKEPWHDFGIDVAKRGQSTKTKQDKPARGTYVPPHKRKNTVQDVEDSEAAPEIAAVQEASQQLANEATFERQRPRSRSPQFLSGPLSPTYQEIDAIMENINGEPDFGIEEHDVSNKLPAPVKSPMKKDHTSANSPQLRESNLSAFQNGPKSKSSAVSADWLREQQQSMRADASPVRKLVGTKDTQVSDWDDMLESGDESKLVPHAQFFDTRIKSLIEGVLQQHLNPLQKSLKEVDSSVRAASKDVTHQVAATTDKTDSDADDEDNVEGAQPARRTRRSEQKLEQMRAIVTEAIKPLAMGNTAIPDASEIRAMIAEELKPLNHQKPAIDFEQVHTIVRDAIAAGDAGRGGLDVDQMRIVVAESAKAFGPSFAPSFDPERIRVLVTDAVKTSAPTAPSFDPEQMRSMVTDVVTSAPVKSPFELQQLRTIVAEAVKASTPPPPPPPPPTNEFDPEHMKLVVAETIKAFGIASSSINPEQMRSIVTEAMKTSTPIAETFDPEHMKLVVTETVKALGGPHEPFDPENWRSVVDESVKANAPTPGPAFDPDEIRAIVKEVVNFSKAGETAPLEPEHIRSIVIEAIASTGIKEAISVSSEASQLTVKANLERIESEIRLRNDAEAKSRDLEKMLELSEKEISLYKENATHADNRIQSLREDKQAAQDQIVDLEKTERELKARLSGQSSEISALEGTLDEYRTSSTRWRQEIDSVTQTREGLHITIEKLRHEISEHQQVRDELNSKSESLQEKLAGVARNFADERDANLKKNDELRTFSGAIEALKEKLQFATNAHNTDREAFRRKDEEASKELTVLSARLEEEMRIRHRLESNLQAMAAHERDAIKSSVQLEETRHSNARLIAEVQKLREESLAAQNDINMREREAMEAKDIARAEIQRSKSLLEAEMEVAKRKFDGVRTELETRLQHVRQELQTSKRESEQQRKDYTRRADESNQARINVVRETTETINVARNEERARFDRHVAELAREHDMAMHRALDDHQRGEVHFREALKVKDDKMQLLEDKCKHLEDKVTVAQSAAQAAATAAQQQQTVKAQSRETLRPSDRVSPQALRESIVVLQEQLQERESRIESLESERVQLIKAREAENKLVARETEINWLRELLGVRVDDLTELVNMLSDDSYDRVEARDAAIRIRANLQMEQQEKERLIGQTNKSAGLPTTNLTSSGGTRAHGLQDQGREMLRDVSNFATPRAAQIAAAWGNWRRGQVTPSLSSIRDAVANPSPSHRGERSDSFLSNATAVGRAEKGVASSATAAQTFLTGLMTPPASNYVRRTPTPTSTLHKGKQRERQPSFSTDGHESDAQPLSLSLEDELEATGADETSPQPSPTRARPSRLKTPQAMPGVSIGENEDPLRTPLQPKAMTLGGSEDLDAEEARHAVRSLEDELADGSEGIGNTLEVAADAVVSPLGPPEDLVDRA